MSSIPTQQPRKPIRNMACLVTTNERTSSQSLPAAICSNRTVSWHDIPEELRERIYTQYFATTSYTIHNPNGEMATVMTTTTSDSKKLIAFPNKFVKSQCPTRPAPESKDKFWKSPSTISTTIHSKQVNLFLVHPEIIYSAHPIWLANSTFHFAGCIIGNIPCPPYHTAYQTIGLGIPKLPHYRTHISKLSIPNRWLSSLRRFECDLDTVYQHIEILDVLAEWAANADQKEKRRKGKEIGQGKELQFTLVYKGLQVHFNHFKAADMIEQKGMINVDIEFMGNEWHGWEQGLEDIGWMWSDELMDR